MKRIVFLCFSFLFLLCGCAEEEKAVSVISETYASKYLEYEAATECDFTLIGETKTLKIGQKTGAFTLTKLYAKEGGVRATLNCDLTVSGELNYKNGGVYGELLRFTPKNAGEFPVISGAENPKWFVVLENGNPFDTLGVEKDSPAKKETEIKISAFHIHKSQENTICYIEIN